jgi:hypothetical protein
MRPLTTLAFLFILAGTGLAKSPVGDWQAVQQDIPRGWQITVVTSFTFPCIFEQADKDELVCQALQRNRRDSEAGEIHLRRNRIREIRAERRDGADMLAGAAGGGGLGAVLGAVLVAGGRGPSAYLLGLGGASIGAHSGRDLHILHGKVIYRRMPTDKETGELPPPAQTSARTSP